MSSKSRRLAVILAVVLVALVAFAVVSVVGQQAVDEQTAELRSGLEQDMRDLTFAEIHANYVQTVLGQDTPSEASYLPSGRAQFQGAQVTEHQATFWFEVGSLLTSACITVVISDVGHSLETFTPKADRVCGAGTR